MKIDRNEIVKERDLLRSQIQSMGEGAVNTLLAAADALDQLNSERAQEIIEADSYFNNLYQTIHDECLVIIARHQPVASDLREIIADLQIAVELERIADHIASIARLIHLIKPDGIPPVLTEIMNMMKRCAEMMEKMLRAFQEHDPASAEVTATIDEDIDRMNYQIVMEILDFMKKNVDAIDNGTHLIWLTHNIERIGDRITNIGEQILFSTSGAIIDWNISRDK